MYDPKYGNGINAEGVSTSLTSPGTTYNPLPIQLQHEIINNYGLRFLNKYLKNNSDDVMAMATTTLPICQRTTTTRRKSSFGPIARTYGMKTSQ